MEQKRSKFSIIKQHLIHGIKLRQFKDKLPSENELARKFKVSRMTARKVLSDLEAEGMVERLQGKGTFIKKQDFASAFFTIQPSREHAKKLNLRHASKVLELTMLDQPPAEIGKRLNYNQQVVFVRRLHFFNQAPVRYEIRYLRGDLCGRLFWEDLEKESIHELLVSKYDLPLTNVWQKVTAEIMDTPVSDVFGVDAGDPVFHIERITYTFDNPVTSVEYFIKGDVAFEDTFVPYGPTINE